MRDEDDIQNMADKAADEIAKINDGEITPSLAYRRERLRAILDALDWALDENIEDDPV